jgi:hypothetical protein
MTGKRNEEERVLFDKMWIIHSYHALLNKSGLTGLINANLMKVDTRLNSINTKTKTIIRDCKIT